MQKRPTSEQEQNDCYYKQRLRFFVNFFKSFSVNYNLQLQILLEWRENTLALDQDWQSCERRSCLIERWISHRRSNQPNLKSKMMRSQRLLQGCYNVYLTQYFVWQDQRSSG